MTADSRARRRASWGGPARREDTFARQAKYSANFPLAQLPNPADLFVPSVPHLPSTVGGNSSTSINPSSLLHMSSGYLPARGAEPAGSGKAQGNAHLFFALERARHTADKRRLIIWFNGGPGCSSFDGLMMEIGAFRPDGNGKLEWSPPGGAWNEYADVLYLDQPVGTGFSYASTSAYAKTLEQAAEEVVYFLRQFVTVYPEYAAGNGVDVYLAGESFAGHYIPFTAAALLEARDKGGGWPIDLKGVAIGNGISDPKVQDGTELEMMVEAKIWEKGGKEYNQVLPLVEACKKERDAVKGNPRSMGSCDRILPRIIHITTQKSGAETRCINIYDVRLSDTSPACGMNWPPILKPTYEYLRLPEVRKALHVDDTNKPEAWIECSSRVSSALREGEAGSIHFPRLLEGGLQLMLFAGDQDLICNHIGVRRTAEAIKWGPADKKSWAEEAKSKAWFVNNKPAGQWRSAQNLTYVSLAGASHMVGFDRPVEAHDMMLRFMGVDLLNAAGPSARIPSRVEGEPDRLVIVGGGGGALKDERPMIPGVDGKTEEQVKDEAKWAAYYNAGSAALIILLILVAVGGYTLLRLRRRARMDRIALHHRDDSGAYTPSALETPHELQHLVVDHGADEDDDEDGDVGRASQEGRYRGNGDLGRGDKRERATGASRDRVAFDTRQNTVHPVPRGEAAGAAQDGVARSDGEVLFGLGEDDDEEDEEEDDGRDGHRRGANGSAR